MSKADREAMLDRNHPDLSIRRQCALLGLARSGVYRPKAPTNDADFTVRRRLDELFTAHPFLGSRRMTTLLRIEGVRINRKRGQRLMRSMGITALGPKPRATQPAPGHKIDPYLLRDLTIDRPNQVWAADLTYLPIGRGFLYLVAVIDWASRAVLAWRLSNTMDTAFCVAALEDALARFGTPDIFNTDQGSQFTSAAFIGVLAAAGIRIAMDGRGRWMDNVFIERLWRSLKHEDIYLKGYADGGEAHRGIAGWIIFYNEVRPHQALDDRTPMAVWRNGITGPLQMNAVDMPLRLDNAAALPTCPPRQQPQPIRFLVSGAGRSWSLFQSKSPTWWSHQRGPLQTLALLRHNRRSDRSRQAPGAERSNKYRAGSDRLVRWADRGGGVRSHAGNSRNRPRGRQRDLR